MYVYFYGSISLLVCASIALLCKQIFVMSWTNDVILEFLDLYRREQILWDPKHPLHRNRSEVTSAWHRIQSTLSTNCSVNDLKRKKESLMTSFRMHFNKKKKCPEEYRTSWFAYALMESFLGGKYECDSTNQMDNELVENATPYTHQVIISEHNVSRQNVKSSERSNTAVRQGRSRSQTKGNHDYIYAKKEMEDDGHYFTSAEDKNEMDEYDLYGQLLAKKLRKLDEHQRDVAMHEIDNIMFRVKVQGSTSQSRTYTSSSPSAAPRRGKSPVFIVTQPSQVQYEDENVPYEAHMQGQPPS